MKIRVGRETVIFLIHFSKRLSHVYITLELGIKEFLYLYEDLIEYEYEACPSSSEY